MYFYTQQAQQQPAVVRNLFILPTDMNMDRTIHQINPHSMEKKKINVLKMVFIAKKKKTFNLLHEIKADAEDVTGSVSLKSTLFTDHHNNFTFFSSMRANRLVLKNEKFWFMVCGVERLTA